VASCYVASCKGTRSDTPICYYMDTINFSVVILFISKEAVTCGTVNLKAGMFSARSNNDRRLYCMHLYITAVANP
jgi:hypothetical protein